MANRRSQQPQQGGGLKQLASVVLPALTGGQIRADEAGELLDAVTDVVDQTKNEVANAERQGAGRGRSAGKVGVMMAGGLTAATLAVRFPIIKQFLVSGLEMAANITGLEFLDNLAGTARDFLKVVHRPGEVERFFTQFESPEQLVEGLIYGRDEAELSNQDFRAGLVKVKRMALSANQNAVWDRIEASGDMEDNRDYLGAIARFDNNVLALFKKRDGDRMEAFARALSEFISTSDKLHVDRAATLAFVERYLESGEALKPYAEFLSSVKSAQSYDELDSQHHGVNRRFLEPLFNALKGQSTTSSSRQAAQPAASIEEHIIKAATKEPAQFLSEVQSLFSSIRSGDGNSVSDKEQQAWGVLRKVATDMRYNPAVCTVASGILHVQAQIMGVTDPQEQINKVKTWAADWDYDHGLENMPQTFLQTALRISGATRETLTAFRHGTMQQMLDFVHADPAATELVVIQH